MTYIPDNDSGGGPGWAEDAIWVDGATTVAGGDQNGNQNTPFATISAAVAEAVSRQDALPVGILPSQRAGTRQMIVVASGFYDEALALTRGNTFYEFVALGPVTLGDGAADANFGSTVPRDVTWANTQLQENADRGAAGSNRRPQLIFSTYHDVSGDATSTHIQIADGWDISGSLILDNPDGGAGATTGELHLSNVRVRGELEASGDAGIRNCYFRGCRFNDRIINSPINGLFLQIAHRCVFEGASSGFEFYNRIVECVLQEDFSADLISAANGVGTAGIYDTVFGNRVAAAPMTFTTSGGGTLLVDAASNYWFKTVGGGSALVGGTKTIAGDLTP